MNKPFSLIRLYTKIDNLKKIWRKQLNSKNEWRRKYLTLLTEYKTVLIENNKLKRGRRNDW
jgi:hypothetical protein